MADDLGWYDVGFMGSKYFETPALDALADESVVFENAFMYPTCSPSRAALLTGRQSFRTSSYCVPVLEKGKKGETLFSKWTVTEEHPLYSQPLNTAGYQLIHLGKWHIVGPDPKSEAAIFASGKKLTQPANGNISWVEEHRTDEVKAFYPEGRGFHKNVGGCWWGDPARGYGKGYNAPGGGYVAPFKNPFIEDKEDDAWLTDRLTDDAIEFMKVSKGKPFFVNLHYYSPHRPSVQRNDELLAHFNAKEGDPVSGQGMDKQKGEIAAYASMVKSLDDNVARILTYLDESGQRENTVVIFTSDNGFNGIQSSCKLLRGAKGNVYDGGLRVPAIVHWKGKFQPKKVTTPISGLDYFPTFLSLAGIKDYTETLDGDTMLPLLEGTETLERNIYWHLPSQYKDKACSIVRQGNWKLIQFHVSGKVELYNTMLDLGEKKNLVKSSQDKADELLKDLTAWRKEHKAPLPAKSKLER